MTPEFPYSFTRSYHTNNPFVTYSQWDRDMHWLLDNIGEQMYDWTVVDSIDSTVDCLQRIYFFRTLEDKMLFVLSTGA